jgi:hypothetical protein
MYLRTIVCLANSKKPPSGRCVAGKELDGPREGHWVRPVSAREGQEVSEDERRYENGRRAQLLDIINVPLISHQPTGHQVENHILDSDYYWEPIGRATWAQVIALIDPYDANFWQPGESTHHGVHDKISEFITPSITSSLKLIRPESFFLVVQREEGYEGRPSRKRVRGRFNYHGRFYILSVTDPWVEDDYLTRNEGTYEIENAVLCISLAGVWNGYAFRLVASVITPDLFED